LFDVYGMPIYEPYKLFEWWYFFDAYAHDVFERGGIIAASSRMLAPGAAIGIAVWRFRLAKRGTAYGSSRWAEPKEITNSGLTEPAGVFLGKTVTWSRTTYATTVQSM
jgi:type IV secretion system protein VirD4